MTKNLAEELRKALPLLCRASVEVSGAKLYAAGDGDESGDEITPEKRDELLARLAAGQFVAVDADILAYEQQSDTANRRFVRFRDGSILALAGSGKGKPFLRDHEQHDSMAVAGRILSSKGVKLADGHYEIRQRVRLTAAWAAELALRDLLFAVSIGWEPTGPVECSVCTAPIYTKCYHWPGDTVTETPQADGTKKYLRDRNGALTVQWIYTSASLLETSMCPIGAVRLAGFEGVRAALAAAFPEDADGDGIERTPSDARNSTTAIASENVITTTPQAEPKMDAKDTEIADLKTRSATLSGLLLVAATLPDGQRTHAAKLAVPALETFLGKSPADREAEVKSALAADPVRYTTKKGREVRESDGALAIDQAKQLDEQAEVLEQQKLQLAAARDAEQLATLRAQITKDIPALGGAEATKLAVLGAVAGIKDEATRTAALEMLRGANAAMASLGTAKGVNPGSDPVPADKTSAFAALDKGLTAWCKANNITAVWTEGLSAYARTPEGKALADAYNATLA